MINAADLLPAEEKPVMARSLFAAEAVTVIDGEATTGDNGSVDEEPITLEQAKKHLRVVFSDEDDYISMLITVARQMAEGRLNRSLVRRQVEATFSSYMGIRLLKPPIVSVDSVSYFNESEVETDLSGYKIQKDASGVSVRFGTGFYIGDIAPRPDAITVRYTVGYESGEVPAPIIQWMLLSIGTMYENRETIINGVSSAPLADDFAKWLLQPYMVYE